MFGWAEAETFLPPQALRQVHDLSSGRQYCRGTRHTQFPISVDLIMDFVIAINVFVIKYQRCV